MLLLNAFMQVDNDTKRTLVSTLVLTVVDVVGDFLKENCFLKISKSTEIVG
jgi:hypothetical protein